MAQDVAYHELAPMFPGGSDDPLRIDHRRSQRLFDEDIRARFHGGNRIVCMAVGICVDGNEVRLQLGECLVEGGMDRVSAKLFRQGHDGAIDQPDDLETRIVVIGERMAAAQIAEPRHENPHRLSSHHLTAPEVMPRINCREKIR